MRQHLHISGRVQGVGFRFFARDHARRLGVTGHVRNLADGRVEVVAEADSSILNQFITCLKKGPALAAVQSVKSSLVLSTSSFNTFEIHS